MNTLQELPDAEQGFDLVVLLGGKSSLPYPRPHALATAARRLLRRLGLLLFETDGVAEMLRYRSWTECHAPCDLRVVRRFWLFPNQGEIRLALLLDDVGQMARYFCNYLFYGCFAEPGTYPQPLFFGDHDGLALLGQSVVHRAPFRTGSRGTPTYPCVLAALGWLIRLGKDPADASAAMRVLRQAVAPLFYTCWLHRALREARRTRGAPVAGPYLGLLRLCIRQRNTPGPQWVFA